MRRWALTCLVAICAMGAPAATAQSSGSLVLFGSLDGHAPVSTTDVPAHTSGELTVSFHGDPATGCAAQGICGYSGTVVFRPGSQGDLSLSQYRIHGHSSYQVQLSLPGGAGTTFTGARVTRAGGGVCSDARQPNAALTGTITGNQVAIGLIQPRGGLLSTRCAGPLDADLAGAGPEIRLTLGQLRRGRRAVPLSGTWSFAAGGFAGTVESNLTMALGKPVAQPSSASPHFPGGIKTQRDREVTETLTLVRGAGNLSLALNGDPSACQFLDSCGIQGTLNGAFSPTGGTASLFVLGPATRPYADFLAALGLSRRGNPRGLHVDGTVAWQDSGTVMAQVARGVSCASSAPLPGGVVILGTTGRGLGATYSPAGSPRTRCPGPELAQFQTLASGSVGVAALGKPTFTLRLSGSGPLGDDGYTISQRTSLTLTLKRGHVHEQTLLTPAG